MLLKLRKHFVPYKYKSLIISIENIRGSEYNNSKRGSFDMSLLLFMSILMKKNNEFVVKEQ